MMLSPFAANDASPALNRQQQNPQAPQQHAYRLEYASKLGVDPNVGVFPALSPRASRLLSTNGPESDRDPFSETSSVLGFGGPLSFGHDGLAGVKMFDLKPFATSSALTTADLQFSGYILNGGHGTGRADLAQRGPSSGMPASLDGNSYLFDAQGAGEARPLPAPALAKRGSSTLAHSHIGSLGAAAGVIGAQASSVSSTPYHGFASVGTGPMMEYSSYASLLNKASLMFDSNLDSMTVDW
ncbi:hypothetical protein LPJ61_000990 [Coemansia biformis]|uniref:Uncharacterized protein n=1 Tax=Coemansia biformis TaxID=1286918 RepID=A0A9W7YAU5_9FUNG|nr:hypothetical protein LPJ61_000990 [Coemansia biformis]